MRAFAALIPFACNFYRCLEGLSGKRLGRFQVARTRIRHILNSFFFSFSFYVSSEIQVARMLLASCKVLLASCKVPLASCKVPLASCKVPLASCKVPLASCKVGLASCKAHLRMSDQRCPLPYISIHTLPKSRNNHSCSRAVTSLLCTLKIGASGPIFDIHSHEKLQLQSYQGRA